MPRSLAVCLALLLPAVAAAQDNLFTPHHVAKLRSVTSAVIAPDGTQVAYILSVPRQLPKEKDGLARAELHVVDTRGNSTPFITGAVNIDSIAWTPDGKSISFLTKRDKDDHRSLYVIPARGGESRRVVAHGSDIHGYSWAPDGKQVAFLATAMAPKERKAREGQGFTQEIYEEDTPPVRVWIAEIDSDKPARDLALKGSASELHWSPLGSHLAVALASTPGIDEHLMFRKVHTVDIKTGKATDLKNPGKLGEIAWSPDGKQLAIITGADLHDPKEGRVWIRGAESGDWTKLDIGKNGHAHTFAWVGNDSMLVPVATGVQTMWHGKFNNSDKTGSTFDTGNPSQVIVDHVRACRNAFAMVAQTPTHPPEVYLQINRDVRQLTHHNPWLHEMAFAKQEVVKYKARDGLELEGILVRPLNEKKGERYPLVVTVHGGPEAHVSNGWSTLYHSLGQVGAARGMAVFYPNYRGSTGRGVAFSMMGQKEAAGKEFDDIVDGVDHLVKTGLVDPKRVGITGGSYGGYATAWGSTYYSDRFAAGVMFVGISDWVSCSGTTDIPHEMHLVHHRKWLWEDWDYFLKASPLKHLDKARTPLLILHGKSDPRVNPGQSLELYRHLKVRGQAPVRLVLYPGEGHGNRRAASRLDYNLRLLQWMEHYLKGPGGAMPPYEIDYGLTAPARSSGGRPVAPPRFLTETTFVDESHPAFCTRRGCPCCIGP